MKKLVLILALLFLFPCFGFAEGEIVPIETSSIIDNSVSIDNGEGGSVVYININSNGGDISGVYVGTIPNDMIANEPPEVKEVIPQTMMGVSNRPYWISWAEIINNKSFSQTALIEIGNSLFSVYIPAKGCTSVIFSDWVGEGKYQVTLFANAEDLLLEPHLITAR